jgi:hypothetical protein
MPRTCSQAAPAATLVCHSHIDRFGLSMIARARPQGIHVSRWLAPKIGFLAVLASAAVAPLAHAQVNIDQGKSPAEIFSNDCATCHKSTRGLAAGKNSLMLSGFLREHYTASRDEASALAAYVLGAGGSEAPPKQKTAEPKTPESKTPEIRTQEPKTAERPLGASAKTEEGTPSIMKPERPAVEETKHEDMPPVTAPKPEPAAPAVAAPVTAPAASPVAVTPAPATAEAPGLEFSPTTSAAEPAQSQPGDSTPVPRDHIPD